LPLDLTVSASSAYQISVMSSGGVGDDPGVTARSNPPDPPTPRPLSNWTIAAGALVLLAVVAVVWFVLLRRYSEHGAQGQFGLYIIVLFARYAFC
jgi:hypothetical protein